MDFFQNSFIIGNFRSSATVAEEVKLPSKMEF
jgi:hypothetical protein